MPRHGGLLSEKVILPDTEFLDRTMRALFRRKFLLLVTQDQ